MGARSEIAAAVAHPLQRRLHIQLAARNAESLVTEKTDIELRYKVNVTLHEFDALDTVSHLDFARQITLSLKLS